MHTSICCTLAASIGKEFKDWENLVAKVLQKIFKLWIVYFLFSNINEILEKSMEGRLKDFIEATHTHAHTHTHIITSQ